MQIGPIPNITKSWCPSEFADRRHNCLIAFWRRDARSMPSKRVFSDAGRIRGAAMAIGLGTSPHLHAETL